NESIRHRDTFQACRTSVANLARRERPASLDGGKEQGGSRRKNSLRRCCPGGGYWVSWPRPGERGWGEVGMVEGRTASSEDHRASVAGAHSIGIIEPLA